MDAVTAPFFLDWQPDAAGEFGGSDKFR